MKLWYWGPFFRHEAPQAGRFRQFTQVGRRGARLRRPVARRRADPAARASCSRRPGRGPARLRLSSLGTPETRARLPRGAARLPARARGRAVRRGARAARPEPAARLRRRPSRARSAVMARGAAAARPARAPTTPSTSPRCARCSTTAGHGATRSTPTLVRGLDYYTRTVFEFESERLGAQSGAGRRRALRRPGRGARRAAHARRGLGRGRRAHPAGGRTASRRPAPRVYVAAGQAATGGATPSRWRGACAPAGVRVEIEQAGRSLKGQLKQADRIGARATVIVGDAIEVKDMDERRAARGGGTRRGGGAGGEGAAMKAPRPNRYRDRWAGELRARRRRRDAARGRLGAPPPRPRRADLHRPARPHRPAAARLPARGGARGARRRRAPARRGRDHRPSGELLRREEGTVNPEPADRRGRAGGERVRAAGRRRDAAVPDRRGRAGGRGAAPALPLPRPAQGAHARHDGAAPRRGQDDPRPPQRRGLPRDRDADPHALDARGRARLPRAEPADAGLLVRAAAVAPALQAAADDGRPRALLPDRALLPRRGLPRRPPARVHPARRGDGLRRGGGRARAGRPAARARAGARRDRGASCRSSACPTTRRCCATAPTGPTAGSAWRSRT